MNSFDSLLRKTFQKKTDGQMLYFLMIRIAEHISCQSSNIDGLDY